MVFRLDDSISFPDPRLADPDGLLAIGGDLSVDRLLLAYSHGIFPWYSFRDCDNIHWYCPHERFVIFPDEIHVSHSMRTLMRKRLYEITFNTHFDAVIAQCSRLRLGEEGAWLGPDMIAAYKRLLALADGSPVAVCGDSAGGTLSMAVTLMAIDRGLPVPCAQLLTYPAVELYNTKGTVHGYDMMLRSGIVKELIEQRVKFLKKTLCRGNNHE